MKRITQYTHAIWRVEQGLPQNQVLSIAQTPDGYLWLATERGVVRFDGLQFTLFNQTNTPELKSNLVVVLLADLEGTLWIGTQGGGLTRLRDGKFITYSKKNGLPNESVACLFAGRDRSLWIGTDGGGVTHFENNRFTTYTVAEGLADNSVFAMAEDREGALWIGTNRGVSRLLNGRFRNYRTSDEAALDNLRSLFVDRSGTVWVGGLGGLGRYVNGRFEVVKGTGFAGKDIRSIAEDRAGSLWIGTVGSGVGRFDGTRWTSYTTKDGLSGDEVRALFEDRSGSLWVGTDAGLEEFRNGRMTSWDTPEGLSNSVALGVYEDRHGSLWIGTSDGLNCFRDRKFNILNTTEGQSHNQVFSIAEDTSGSLWLGTARGLKRLRNGTLTVFSKKDGLPGASAVASYVDRKGVLWVGTHGGLSRFQDGRFATYTTKNGMSNNFVQAIEEDRSGNLWIGTNGGGVNRFEDGHFEIFDSSRGLSCESIMSLYADSEGTLWIGTADGLNRLKDGRITAFKGPSGMPDDAIFRILEDSKDNLWLSSNQGIFRVSKKDLSEFAKGDSRHVTSVLYGTADGMKSKECNGGFQPAGWKDHDGKLWFPTAKGVVEIDPNQMDESEPAPPVYIEQTLINRQLINSGSPAAIPPGAGELEFHYAAVSFLPPGRVAYKYKLEGFDPDWIDAGSRRSAFYTNIPPGHYRFRVTASDRDDIWNSQGSQSEFSLLPHYYQTVTFRVICLGLICVIAGGLHRWRAQSIEARQRELERLVLQRTAELEQSHRNLQAMATHDSLTQLWNRHSIMEILTNELARCEREQTTLALVLVDLDYFKQINDVHGHLAGDAVLREISRRFLSCMRPYDSAGRYGGEEFLLVLSGVPAAELEMRLREIHRNVCAGEFPTSGQGQVRVTCSFGVVRAGAELTSVEQVVSRADAALYRAKALGRNRIEYAEEGECPGEVRKQSVNDRGASKVGLQR